jgi:hypothetical protein
MTITRFAARHILLATTFALGLTVPASLRAQDRPTVSGPGGYLTVGGGISTYQADYGQRRIAGAMAFSDSNLTWRYGMESELRYLRFHTDEDVTETNYFIGPRMSLDPGFRLGRFRPYAKLLVGAGKMTFPFRYATGTFFTVAPGGGLDVVLSDRVNLRLIDMEYQSWTSFNFGPMHPYGLSAGLSFRLNGHSRPARTGRW